jgi:acyl-coenzyme A thioesterase PaaI-like protein
MQALNEQFLPGNMCFGCGLENPEGLHIRVYRDGDREDALIGNFEPRPTMGGFPFIVHGGLQFTALDCMAAWCCLVLLAKGAKVVPLTRSASMRYARPARIGASFSLRAQIVKQPASPKDPVIIRTALLEDEATTLSEADFDYVLMPQERFKPTLGIDVMPDPYRHHFGEL